MSRLLKIVIDSDIPYIKEVLEPFAQVLYLKGMEIESSIVADADALVIRTRTKCNAELLEGSSVKAIFTATIGRDHIDIEYCKLKGIKIFSADGCNAYGVMQYVVSALFYLFNSLKIRDIKKRVIGVIGAGNIGEKVATFFEECGFKVLRCDPPKATLNNGITYYSLEYLLSQSDIVTFHVPLDESTKNLCSHSLFSKLKRGVIFINTSRGEVVDESALLSHREEFLSVVLDVWQKEPSINRELVTLCDIATPHIAGYSLEGKVNATQISVQNLAHHFNIEQLKSFKIDIERVVEPQEWEFKGESPLERVSTFLLNRFDIVEESQKLKGNIEGFEQLRSSYRYRRELPMSTASIIGGIIK